jgi:hypothetical protein
LGAMRLAGPVPFLLMALAGACARRAKQSAVRADGASPVASAAPSSGLGGFPAGTTDAVFSAPIAASRVGHTSIVAGLVAARGAIRVVGFPDGQPSWAMAALGNVAWTPEAELKLQPAVDGAALVWRGSVEDKSRTTLVELGLHGELRGNPSEVGAALCTTSDGLAWIVPHPGPAHVLSRRWSEAVAREVMAISPERTPALVCGDHDVFVLGDGDDDVTSSVFAPGDATGQPPVVVIRNADFADAEEREHDAYTIGDDMGIVRVGGSGAIAMREISRAGGRTPWRKLRHALSADDDVVAVDGDPAATLVVFTHESDATCSGAEATAESVRAVRVDRKTGDESIVDLSPPDCGVSPGPFWIAGAPAGAAVAWVERMSKPPPKAAPIGGLAFRVLRADGVRAGHIEAHADALVEAGCDDTGCFAVALVRGPDVGAPPASPGRGRNLDDGLQPMPMVVLRYP